MSVDLRPLPYHQSVATILEAENPKAFATLRSTVSNTDHVQQALLRHAYRLDPAGHADVHAAVARAGAALGLDVPVDLYAHEGVGENNAELIFIPGRPVIAVSGDTLNLLTPDELCAIAGHELAHYVLWSADGGRYLATSRLLDAADGDARTPSEYLETARRFRMATELYADRGALKASESLLVTLTSLLKLTTGLAQVDPEGYLRQAAEVDFTKPSTGTSHPETVLRAWALQRWQDDAVNAESDIVRALASQLDLNSLDIVDQDHLRDVTFALVTAVVGDQEMRTEDVLEHAGRFGVTESARPTTVAVTLDQIAPETRRYLASVLLDFATIDADLGADGIARMIALARRAGLGKEIDKLVDAELDLSDRARAKLAVRVSELA